MKRITVEANSEAKACKICLHEYGWTPDAVREVDSGDEDTKAFMCFESAGDADLWDNQI